MSSDLSRREFLTRSARAGSVVSLALLGCRGARPVAPTATTTRRRLRELGIEIGLLPPGQHNAITDVAGVAVGHVTRIEGEGSQVVGQGPIRTGVTAILPSADVVTNNVACARYIINGNGELTGLGSVDQRGALTTPVFLTDSSNVGRVMNGALSWMLDTYPALGDTAPVPVPVVGETWGAFLHDAAGRHLTDEHVRRAIEAASGGPVAEGNVGGGTAMVCYEFKGGIGTSSRVLPDSHGGYTVGVLVQANHGKRRLLTVDGVPVGQQLTDHMLVTGRKEKSIVIVGATDAPMIPAQLERLCKRAAFGLARTGSISAHSSGDLALFFSTETVHTRGVAPVDVFNDEWMTEAHRAAQEATEEAILNALCMAETMVGIDGNTAHAMPLDRMLAIVRRHGRAAGAP